LPPIRHSRLAAGSPLTRPKAHHPHRARSGASVVGPRRQGRWSL